MASGSGIVEGMFLPLEDNYIFLKDIYYCLCWQAVSPTFGNSGLVDLERFREMQLEWWREKLHKQRAEERTGGRFSARRDVGWAFSPSFCKRAPLRGALAGKSGLRF
jgi:hypothetical protein